MQTNPARTQTQIQQGPEKTYLCTGFFFFLFIISYVKATINGVDSPDFIAVS